MSEGKKVIVAVYEHRHGRDVRVFERPEGAAEWRRDLAFQYWEEHFDEPAPENLDELVESYWKRVGERLGNNEYFETEECEFER